jgi:hypothetical protein
LYKVVNRFDNTFKAGISILPPNHYSYLLKPKLAATSLKHCLHSIILYFWIMPTYEPHLLHHLFPLPCGSNFLPVTPYSRGLGIILILLHIVVGRIQLLLVWLFYVFYQFYCFPFSWQFYSLVVLVQH